VKDLHPPATEQSERLKVQQTTTSSTRSICIPSSFEQQQPSKQNLIQEQEASSGKAPKEQNDNADRAQESEPPKG